MKRNSKIVIVVLALLAGAAALSAVLVVSSTPPAVEPSTPKTLWTCSMHPQVIQDKPGNCPICGMKLTPIRPDSSGGAAVTIDPVQIQNIGIRVAPAEKGPLTLSLRTV